MKKGRQEDVEMVATVYRLTGSMEQARATARYLVAQNDLKNYRDRNLRQVARSLVSEAVAMVHKQLWEEQGGHTYRAKVDESLDQFDKIMDDIKEQMMTAFSVPVAWTKALQRKK